MEAQFEESYQAAVQSFIRRDHSRTQAHIQRLLALCSQLSPAPSSYLWYDLGSSEPRSHSTEEQVIKTLKLFISSHASLYSEPPTDRSHLTAAVRNLLPPSPPNALLTHVLSTCEKIAGPLLPPSLVTSLLLASLKLRPSSSSLTFAHDLVERWLTDLPDSFILAISPAAPHATNGTTNGHSKSSPEEQKRVESAREGYLKVIELFVGEVLTREGEFEMARGILDGEMIMSSKRKESLYRHLRSVEAKCRSPSSSMTLSSPSSSAILDPSQPNPTGAKSKTNGKPRSRSSSTSSSSSERTARPGEGSARLEGRLKALKSTVSADSKVKRKGKAEEPDETHLPAPSNHSSSSASTSVPRKIWVNPPSGSTNRQPITMTTRLSNLVQSSLALLPPPISSRLSSLASNDWILSALKIPLPIIALIMLLVAIRRRIRRRAAVVAGTGVLAERAVLDVRERLRLVRGGRGFREWLGWFLRWWVEKFVGVWKLGTTITYV